METEAVTSCDLCDCSRSIPFLRAGTWSLVQCRDCRVIYLNPRPRDFLYGEDYFAGRVSEGGERIWGDDDAIPAAQIRAQSWHLELLEQRALPPNCTRGTLLDAGCATGTFLAAARERGWRTFGADVAPAALRLAKAQLQLAVANATLLAQPFTCDAFNVVTAYHTLEHLPSPRRAVQEFCRLLKPHGWLVVEVPNSGSIEARVQGPRWPALRLPYHLYFFTPHTLKRLLRENGFDIIETTTTPTRYLTEWLRRGAPPSATRAPGPGVTRSAHWRARTLLGRLFPGRDLTIYARRATPRA